MDAETYRADSRERWEQVAPGWARQSKAFARDTAPVTRWLIDAVDPQPGQTILELAAGIGEVGLEAAERVGPQGRVIVSDGAEAMVAAAAERAKQAGAQNVETRAMEAEWIDMTTASVDGVLCRWGYMLLADPETALRETRRVLRPGGRVALAAWAARERNPWLALLSEVLVAQDLSEPAAPADPGPFAFAVPGTVDELLAATGFAEIEVGEIAFSVGAPSLEDWWEHQRSQSASLAAAAAGLTPKQHYELRDAFDAAYGPYVGEDGAVSAPAVALVARAEA